ncbi:hypothetical protein ECANGB1_1847 [Enterospora canceri]|uniref:Uncharacterized protein n=1 Tax=Enterospora canceri TaxID=1081671 RepID=A0A1Y1S634_9MICR|nr:hypothetical protein ECANGB1_1847 [Enterospora canceri]
MKNLLGLIYLAKEIICAGYESDEIEVMYHNILIPNDHIPFQNNKIKYTYFKPYLTKLKGILMM